MTNREYILRLLASLDDERLYNIFIGEVESRADWACAIKTRCDICPHLDDDKDCPAECAITAKEWMARNIEYQDMLEEDNG